MFVVPQPAGVAMLPPSWIPRSEGEPVACAPPWPASTWMVPPPADPLANVDPFWFPSSEAHVGPGQATKVTNDAAIAAKLRNQGRRSRL